MMTTIRSFIAIELEDENTIANIVDFSKKIKRNQDKLKVVKPENLHMTLKFLGNIPESLAPKIYEIINKEINLKAFQGRTFEYLLKGVGEFNKFSVIWIKLGGDLQFLQTIKDKIEDSLNVNLNIEREKRTKFKPHLTIGRLKKNKINFKTFESFKKIIKDNRDLSFGSFKVNKVKLKMSVLTPNGPIYSDLVY